jgi:hypothetical protein
MNGLVTNDAWILVIDFSNVTLSRFDPYSYPTIMQRYLKSTRGPHSRIF